MRECAWEGVEGGGGGRAGGKSACVIKGYFAQVGGGGGETAHTSARVTVLSRGREAGSFHLGNREEKFYYKGAAKRGERGVGQRRGCLAKAQAMG